jgi:hypothetical protein
MYFRISFLISMTVLLACKHTISQQPVPNHVAGSVYYVSVTGNDSDNGSIQNPFQTIQYALSKTMPGDTVFVRNGAYHQKISFPVSGRAGKYITLKAFPNETPVIDGTGLTVSGKEALVTIRKASYIILEGFAITNFKSTIPWTDVNGIIVDEGANEVIIRKNRISGIEHNVAAADGRSGHGIEIRGNTNAPVRNILVEENEIHDCNTGYSENLTINGYVDGFIIRKNKVYNGENIGIVAAGGYAANPVAEYNYARNGLIAENEVFNIDGTTGPVPAYSKHNGAIGIYIDGAREIVVERNKVYACGRGIGIVSETNNFPTSGCIVRSNFVWNNSLGGIYLGGYIGYTGGGTRNCHVINNTLFFNSRDLGYSDEVEGELRITADCHDNIIKNNIFVARPERGIFINKESADGTNNAVDFNLYFCTGINTWRWNNVIYKDFNIWQSACRGDSFSVNGKDPLFVDASLFDFHISQISPALNAGFVFSANVQGDKDIDGKERVMNKKISIGAHQNIYPD